MPVEFAHVSAEEMDGIFDTVLLFNMIAYAKADRIRDAARRITAPGGKLVLAEEDPFVPAFFRRYASRAQRELEKMERMPIDSMKRLFEEGGWQQIDETWVPIDSAHGLRGMVFARKDRDKD
jgi:SAM-dependent methyltransferase